MKERRTVGFDNYETLLQKGKNVIKKTAMWTLVTIILFQMDGCASNPFDGFYQGSPNARAIRNYEFSKEQPIIIGSSNLNQDVKSYIQKGYVPIGMSSFSAARGNYNTNDLQSKASEIGAQVVLLSTKFDHTESGFFPLNLSNSSTAFTYSHGSANAFGSNGTFSQADANGTSTTTTYGSQTALIPYSVPISDISAIYLAKFKSRFGVKVAPLDSETRQRRQSNTGVVVQVVIDDSPAFLADLFEGDIIISVANQPVHTAEDFITVIDQNEGKQVEVKIIRNDKTITKTLKILESLPPPAPEDTQIPAPANARRLSK